MNTLKKLMEHMKSNSDQDSQTGNHAAAGAGERQILLEMLGELSKGHVSKQDMVDMIDYFLSTMRFF